MDREKKGKIMIEREEEEEVGVKRRWKQFERS